MMRELADILPAIFLDGNVTINSQDLIQSFSLWQSKGLRAAVPLMLKVNDCSYLCDFSALLAMCDCSCLFWTGDWVEWRSPEIIESLRISSCTNTQNTIPRTGYFIAEKILIFLKFLIQISTLDFLKWNMNLSFHLQDLRVYPPKYPFQTLYNWITFLRIEPSSEDWQ